MKKYTNSIFPCYPTFILFVLLFNLIPHTVRASSWNAVTPKNLKLNIAEEQKNKIIKDQQIPSSQQEKCSNIDNFSGISIDTSLFENSYGTDRFLICYSIGGTSGVSNADQNTNGIPDVVDSIGDELKKLETYLTYLESKGARLPEPLDEKGRYHVMILSINNHDLASYPLYDGYVGGEEKFLFLLDNKQNSDLLRYEMDQMFAYAISRVNGGFPGLSTSAGQTYFGYAVSDIFSKPTILMSFMSYFQERLQKPQVHLMNPSYYYTLVPGSSLFYEYLQEKSGLSHENFIRKLIDIDFKGDMRTKYSSSYGIYVIDQFLKDNGLLWNETLAEYHAWNLLMGPYSLITDVGYSFAEKIWTLDGSVKHSHKHSSFPVTMTASPDKIEGTGASYIKFNTINVTTSGPLAVTIEPTNISADVAMVLIDKNYKVEIKYLGRAETTQKFLTPRDAKEYLQVHVIVFNANENSILNYAIANDRDKVTYRYSAEIQTVK